MTKPPRPGWIPDSWCRRPVGAGAHLNAPKQATRMHKGRIRPRFCLQCHLDGPRSEGVRCARPEGAFDRTVSHAGED